MSLLNENTETVHKLFDATDIPYSQEMKLNDNLKIYSTFHTLYPKYPLQGNKNEGKTDAVIQLEFRKLLKDASQNIMLNEQENTQIQNKYCILVDRSQSMMLENKLKNVKESLSNLLKKINTNSQYALISFGSSQKIIFNFTQVTHENIDSIKDQINNINPTGDTDIVQALEVAHSLIIQDQKLENKVNEQANKKIVRYSIFLLTDGQDNMKEKAIIKIRENFKNKVMNYSINCLGFGIDHDSLLLGGIASYTGGKFYHIKPEESIFPVFENYIKNQQEVVVENVDVQIIQDSQTIQDDSKNQYKFLVSIMPDENVLDAKLNRIYFKNLKQGDEKNILLSLKYKYKLKNDKNTKSQQDVSLSLINDKSTVYRLDNNLLDISLSSINKTSLTSQSQKINDEKIDECQQQFHNEKCFTEETIKSDFISNNSKIYQPSDSQNSLSELLSDFSSLSFGSSIQEQTNSNIYSENQFILQTKDDQINYLNVIKKSQQLLEKGFADASLSELNKLQDLFNSKPLHKFPLYIELQKKVEQSINQINMYQKSKNYDEQQKNKKNYIISQTVSITAYKDQSSTKKNDQIAY
ncbi:hypothetical protein ABPG72_005233 [Tetrahymena utriculariae]